MNIVLPQTAADRKQFPVATGFIDYFPDAVAYVSHISWAGNNQHNPGMPLHWAREKSSDHPDCLMRHFQQRGTYDSDGLLHSGKMGWRAMAILQLELEARFKEQLEKAT